MEILPMMCHHALQTQLIFRQRRLSETSMIRFGTNLWLAPAAIPITIRAL
ncbi:MAG: hypothetical protein M1470_04850 [Bacteroidetes bacterium]|nr:hypothetical protein [Bacteroidota bacterium]